jgi:hypothetical protein
MAQLRRPTSLDESPAERHRMTFSARTGVPWVGTKVLETNTSGRKKEKRTAAAASGFFTSIPAQAPAQVMANAINKHKPNDSLARCQCQWADPGTGTATTPLFDGVI